VVVSGHDRQGIGRPAAEGFEDEILLVGCADLQQIRTESVAQPGTDVMIFLLFKKSAKILAFLTQTEAKF
jgi:hypothetical protein